MDELAAELTATLAQLDATREQLDACAADKARIKAELDRSQAEVNRKRDRESQLEDELARLRAELRELQDNYDAVLRENEEVLARFDTAGGRLSDLVVLLDERERTITDLTGTLRDATEKLAWSQDEMDRLHDQIDVLRARVAELEPLGTIQAERRALQEELETLLTVRDDNLALQAECDKLAHACEDLQEQLQRAVAAQADAEHARLVAEGRAAEVAEDAQFARRESDRLQAELDNHAAARAELLRKHGELESEVAQLQRL
jgi:chromosome segregation ATPase